ncbi:MAG: aminotransferase class V-fold PLP-dependent enzyme [Geothermobacteraceae bacterium]
MAIYLDNAATSFPKPEAVYRAVDQALRHAGGNPGRGGHGLTLEAGRIVLDARESAARFFGVRNSERVVFTPSATEAVNLALFGLLTAGDRVLTSSIEHNAVRRPLYRLQQLGIEVVSLACDPDGRLDLGDLEQQASRGARLLAISHCSNVTGTLQPLEEIAAVCRRFGVMLLVDAAQSAGHVSIDVEALGIDLLAVPGHKGLLGPAGTGLLCVAEDIRLEPLVYGGTGVNSTSLDMPDRLPERFEAGTPNVPGLAGLQAGIAWLEESGPAMIAARVDAMTDRLRRGLEVIDRVKLFGPGADKVRGAVVSFVIEGQDPSVTAFHLDREYGICARAGLHCAPEAHRTIGTFPEGTVRFSPGPFTTETEVDQAVEAVSELARRA